MGAQAVFFFFFFFFFLAFWAAVFLSARFRRTDGAVRPASLARDGLLLAFIRTSVRTPGLSPLLSTCVRS